MGENRFLSPLPGWRGWLQNALANSRKLRAVRRAILPRFPFLKLASDVQDIVYASWVVPTDRVAALVPPGVVLWGRDGSTILTILSYRHGHFGPFAIGSLRRFFPSPLQSNWRLYVDSAAMRLPSAAVLFVRNVFDSALYAIGTRLFSDALPSHLAASFSHDDNETIIEGPGSSPAVRISCPPPLPACSQHGAMR